MGTLKQIKAKRIDMLRKAFESGDFSKCRDFFREDAVYAAPGERVIRRGRSAIAAYLDGWKECDMRKDVSLKAYTVTVRGVPDHWGKKWIQVGTKGIMLFDQKQSAMIGVGYLDWDHEGQIRRMVWRAPKDVWYTLDAYDRDWLPLWKAFDLVASCIQTGRFLPLLNHLAKDCEYIKETFFDDVRSFSYFSRGRGPYALCEELKRLRPYYSEGMSSLWSTLIRGGHGKYEQERYRLESGRMVLGGKSPDMRTPYFLVIDMNQAGQIERIIWKYTDGYQTGVIEETNDEDAKTRFKVSATLFQYGMLGGTDGFVDHLSPAVALCIQQACGADHVTGRDAVAAALAAWRPEGLSICELCETSQSLILTAEFGKECLAVITAESDGEGNIGRIQVEGRHESYAQRPLRLEVIPEDGQWETVNLDIGRDRHCFWISGVLGESLGSMLSVLYAQMPDSARPLLGETWQEAGEKYMKLAQEKGHTWMGSAVTLNSSYADFLRKEDADFYWDQEGPGCVFWKILNMNEKEDGTAEVRLHFENGDTYTYYVDFRSFCYAFCKGLTEALKRWGIRGYVAATAHHDCNLEQFIALKAYAMGREGAVTPRSMTIDVNGDKRGSQYTDFQKEMEIFLADM